MPLLVRNTSTLLERIEWFIYFRKIGLDAFQDARDYKNYSKYPIAKVNSLKDYSLIHFIDDFF
jgi:hypothetical protein